jgi:hypothetical protein
MTTSARPEPARSAFRKELEDFVRQSKRLGNCLLNKTFDLSVVGSQRRIRMLVILFLALGVFLTLIAHSLESWLEAIGGVFQYLFNLSYAQEHPNTFSEFILFAFGAIISPQTLRYLPVFILPFVLAIHAAATYLDDIFELNHVDVARDFIFQVALTGANVKLRIAEGQVATSDQDSSPIYLIGGPGKVLVGFDSVALFEKPDGTPHVIDSTSDSNNTLGGFERFRWAIDLRDQFLDLSERDKSSVTSRSLDGIRIKATDVRLLYRLHRGNLPVTLKQPYPYVKDAVLSLIYDEVRPVTPEGVLPTITGSRRSPTGHTDLQMGALESLIRGELGKFMRKYKLTRYLASHGMPEYEKALERENDIVEISKSIADPDDPAKPQEVSDPPEFEHRPKITNLFTEFTHAFAQGAKDNGVDLHWIGVGTWNPPDEIVPEQHIEAWRLSLENLAKGNPGALKTLEQEKKIREKIQLIQDVPLARFQGDRDNGNNYNYIAKSLLVAYREQLVKIKELLEESEHPIPNEILYAIEYLGNALGHWVGGDDIPPPISP